MIHYTHEKSIMKHERIMINFEEVSLNLVLALCAAKSSFELCGGTWPIFGEMLEGSSSDKLTCRVMLFRCANLLLKIMAIRSGIWLYPLFTLTTLQFQLGLTERHLDDIFSVTKSSVNQVYITWIHFLALAFKESLLRWSSKEEVRVHMPSSFSKYPNTRIIIDCMEFFIEKPSSPSAHHHHHHHHQALMKTVSLQ